MHLACGTSEAVLANRKLSSPPWWPVDHHHVVLGHLSALASLCKAGPVQLSEVPEGTWAQPVQEGEEREEKLHDC